MTRSPDPVQSPFSPQRRSRRLPGPVTPLFRRRGWRPDATPALLAFAVALIVLAACSRISNPEGWSSGLVTDDTLYIGTRDGELVALERNTGQTIWTFALKTEQESDRAIYGTPVLAGGTIYLGGYDGVLYALDRDGFEKWREPIGSPDRSRLERPIVGGPVVAGDVVLIGSSDGKLYALDAIDGTRKWSYATGDKVWSTPTVADDVVYFGSLDKNIYAVGLEDGRMLWKFETDGAVTASPVYAEGRLYVGSFDSNFYAIDAETGREVWRFEGADNWFWTHAVLEGDLVYAPSLDGNLYALDAETGDLAWMLQTEGRIVGSPVVVHDMIAVPSTDGKIRLAKLGNGNELDSCNIGEQIRTSLVERDGFVYFGARDRSIRALQIKKNGNPDEEWVHFTDRDDPLPRNITLSC